MRTEFIQGTHGLDFDKWQLIAETKDEEKLLSLLTGSIYSSDTNRPLIFYDRSRNGVTPVTLTWSEVETRNEKADRLYREAHPFRWSDLFAEIKAALGMG